ncbi:ABC transporter ATP-binding protein [Candidatus Mycoplasma mahonii]|uniref:ABC transporter ATP-binding protein n=1 Tax=Candidatus Mycoplasma mahonii TaxID=3004105 RepID=UPI0026EE1CAD|nr:ATP-binding cassette domain-containing protein [Candidatus Mycoplasma mahonii]WKX02590.1 ATP-binding cassette domain-containing protein [Candidatus Mycoplasma mahonii]
MLREFIIRAHAKFEIILNGQKTFLNILKDEGLENSTGDLFKLYRKIFGESHNQGGIQLEKIGKVYENGFKAVHNFDLKINEHEFISLLGPSGCGKTTILRMIAGLELISEGQLKIGNVVMNSSLPKERGLAMVFQNYALYPYMTVYDNIAFGLKIRTFSNGISSSLLFEALDILNPNYSKIKYLKAEIYNSKYKNKVLLDELKLKIKKERKVGSDHDLLKSLLERRKLLVAEEKSHRCTIGLEEITKFKDEIRHLKKKKIVNKNIEEYKKALKRYTTSLIIWKKTIPARIQYFSEMVGIQDYLRRKPNALSGGQRQRVALVRAISKDASLFLFDEPLSNLDAKLRSSMRTEIRRLHDLLNSSSIFVTHDQIEAMTMSDRIVLMNKGYIQQIGTPSELFNLPTNVFVADFIGTPGINFIEGKLESIDKIKIGKKIIKLSKRSPEIVEQMKGYIGKHIIVGIRPQNVISNLNIISHWKENIFDVETISVESIGHENIVNVKSKELGSLFKIIGGRYFNPKVGEKIKILIDSNTVQIFDGENGFSISTIPNKETMIARDIWINSNDERAKNTILSTKEKSKEKLSHKIVKDLYGFINKKYGKKRKAEKIQFKYDNENVKDDNLMDQVAGKGGN